MRFWMTLALLPLAACDVSWETPLVVGPHTVSPVGTCSMDPGSLQVEEMVLTPVDPYDGAFELHYVHGDVTRELTGCSRGSAVGDSVFCPRSLIEGAVEPPLALVLSLSGWVKAETVEYTLAQALFCAEEDESVCEGLLPESDEVCDLSLQGKGPIED